MTEVVQQQLVPTVPLVVVAAEGVAARFVRRMLEPYDDDLALRVEHVGAAPIDVDLRPFDVSPSPRVVWTSDDGQVRVLAVAVRHEPVPDAVAYRVETPDAVVVISGETRVWSPISSCPPTPPGDAEAFADDLRSGGYPGRITVGEDLTTVAL